MHAPMSLLEDEKNKRERDKVDTERKSITYFVCDADASQSVCLAMYHTKGVGMRREESWFDGLK